MIDEVIKKLEWALQNNTIEDIQSAYEYIIAIKTAIRSLEAWKKVKTEIKYNIDRIPRLKTDIDDGEINGLEAAFIIINKYLQEVTDN